MKLTSVGTLTASDMVLRGPCYNMFSKDRLGTTWSVEIETLVETAPICRDSLSGIRQHTRDPTATVASKRYRSDSKQDPWQEQSFRVLNPACLVQTGLQTYYYYFDTLLYRPIKSLYF